MTEAPNGTTVIDLEPSQATFLEEVSAGLSKTHKTLPCKYFYDERGSRLFDRICELEEYYLTRTELSIMERSAGEMADAIGPRAMLVEYGSGSSRKSRILLDHLQHPIAYVPVDISRQHLQKTADRLSAAYPELDVLPVCADFTDEFDVPEARRLPSRCSVYFPGSTIGNFQPHSVRQTLRRIAVQCGENGGLLIGIDLQKDTDVIEAAYNDRQGVTAEFNLNLLRRINRELNADFDLHEFRHEARYNRPLGRVEIALVSQRDQQVTVGDDVFEFSQGERICTEYSYKYTIAGFADLSGEAGMSLSVAWTDDEQLFAVLYLKVDSS